MKQFFLLLIAALVLGSASLRADAMTTLYVSPHGKDTWTGRLPAPNKQATDGPLATVAGARDRLRVLRRQGTLAGPITVQVRGGTYFLTEPLVFTPEDSGTPQAPVVYTAYRHEKPVLSGGRRITGWHADDRGFWEASVPDARGEAGAFHELFVSGARRPRTSLPKDGSYAGVNTATGPPSPNPAQGADSFIYSHTDFNPTWTNLGDIDVLCYHVWSVSRLRIASLDVPRHIVHFTGATWGSGAPLAKGTRLHVENVFEALPQEPGRWYLNTVTGIVTYHPLPGETLATFAPIAPRLSQLVQFAGDTEKKQWVDNITLRGLSFQDADWTEPAAGYTCSQAEVFQPGALTATGAHGCRLEDCEVAHIGTYAVAWGRACRNDVVTGCHLHDLGAGGVKIGEFRIPADPDDLTRDNAVQDCRIDHAGVVHPAAVGVWIGQSPGNQIVHNDIHDLYYSGISAGWTWGYGPAAAQGTTIAYNRIYDIGQGVLSDMGGIYTLGNQQGSQVTHNIVHDVQAFSYGGWGIYTDEGTTGLTVRDNLVYRCKSASFHQNYGMNNAIENNIFALGAEDQLARTSPEDHLSFTLHSNIIYYTQGVLLDGNWTGGKMEIDDNLYWNTAGPVKFGPWSFEKWQASGQDQHSKIADPLFVAPEKADFTLRPGSPASSVGFQPFSLTDVGPTK